MEEGLSLHNSASEFSKENYDKLLEYYDDNEIEKLFEIYFGMNDKIYHKVIPGNNNINETLEVLKQIRRTDYDSLTKVGFKENKPGFFYWIEKQDKF